MYLRGALESAHFHRMKKVTIQLLCIKLGRYSGKLSIISNQNRLMHNELRYQAKIQAISNMPRKEKKYNFMQFLPNFFFFFFLKKVKNKNSKHALWK
jgi:hypothetical protein